MMNSRGVIIFFIVCSIWSGDVFGQNNNFIITDFGGINDGRTDNKEAFEKAWKKACGTNGGTIKIPKGSFVVSGANFEGPCIGRTEFVVDGTLVADADSSGDPDFWLSFNKVDRLKFSGTGTLDGNGATAWSRCKDSENCDKRPATLRIGKVTNTLIQGIHFVNSKMFHVHMHESQNVDFKNVHITAPENSPNTDGIHVSRSNYVNILDSTISTGDDCVSVGDGTKNLNVFGVLCGPGHGISIGSLGKYDDEEDVSGITVRNCTLTKTDNGLRIKTWAPSKSSILVSRVVFSDIILKSVDNPILIDQYYCPHGSCDHKGESSVEIQGVTYAKVRGSSSVKEAVNIQCSKSKPCKNIDLVGVKITYKGQPSVAKCSSGGVRFKGPNDIPSRCS